MSKSLGNFFTVRDIAKHFPYEVIRFFILNGHYRSPINFSDELMKACQNGLERIKNARKELNFYIKNVADTKMTAEEAAKEALRLAMHKLPCKCKIVSKADLEGGVANEV